MRRPACLKIHRSTWPAAGLILALSVPGIAMAQVQATCGALTPGWGVEGRFAGRDSYWNPLENSLRDSTETNTDRGGTWLFEVGQPPNHQPESVDRLPDLVKSGRTCDGDPVLIPGELVDLRLNGLDFQCFFPDAAARDLVVLDQPATTVGGMHHGPGQPPSAPVYEDLAACSYAPDPQGGHPLNTSVRAFWALGRYLVDFEDAKKLVLTGGSLGSFQIGLTTLVAAADPLFPLVAALGYGGFEAERHFAAGELLTFTLGVNSALGTDLRPIGGFGEDPEMLRVFFKQHGGATLADFDVINFAAELPAGFDLWIYMGDEDLTTHADRDAFDFGQALAGTPAEPSVKLFATRFGGHTGDGFIYPLFLGDGDDPYEGSRDLPLNFCRDLHLMLERENVPNDPLPSWQPIATRGQQPLERRFGEVITPVLSDLAGGPEPGLLEAGDRLGLGSQLAALDTLHAEASAMGGAVDLYFGNFEGEVQRVTVHGDGALEPRWLQRLGYGSYVLVDVSPDRLFAATKEGRAALLDKATGQIITLREPGHVGTNPRQGRLGVAFDGDQPVPLIFVANGEVELLGLDPENLDVVYRNETVGAFEDWGFTNDVQVGALGDSDPSSVPGSSAWVALTRGHLLRVRLTLPDCLEVVAMTPALADLPTHLVVIGEHVLVTDREGHHAFDPQGDEIPLAPGGLLEGCGAEATEEPVRPDILRLVPGTNWLMWQHEHCVAVTDILGFDPDDPRTLAPLAAVENLHSMLSLAAAGGRFFSTTANEVLELVPEVGERVSFTKQPVHVATGGAIGSDIDTETGEIVLLQLLEVPGWHDPASAPGTLVRVDPATGSARRAESGYLFFTSGLAWQGDTFYSTLEGVVLTTDAGPAVVSPMSFEESTLPPALKVEGHLIAARDFVVTGSEPSQLTPFPYGPNRIKGPKVTTNMPGIVNRGSAMVAKEAAPGEAYHRAWLGTAGGRVFRFLLDTADGRAVETLESPIDFGWKAVGLELGDYQGREALFVGTWLDDQELTGSLHVLDAATLEPLAELATGAMTWGIRQVDLEADGTLELIVGTGRDLQVWRQSADGLQLAYRSPPRSVAYGAYGQIYAIAHPDGGIGEIWVWTTGGFQVFSVAR